jgi:hypothetical protein
MLSIGEGERAAAGEKAGFLSPLGLLGRKTMWKSRVRKGVVFLTIEVFHKQKGGVFLTLNAGFFSPYFFKKAGFFSPSLFLFLYIRVRALNYYI